MAADPTLDAVASILTDRGVEAIDCAIVLGTGLGAVAEDIEDAVRIPYAELPGFPRGEVSGHARQLRYGTLHGLSLIHI